MVVHVAPWLASTNRLIVAKLLQPYKKRPGYGAFFIMTPSISGFNACTL